MTVVPPVPLIRQRRIISALQEASALSEKSAVFLNETSLLNPDLFGPVTEKMLEQEIILKTPEGKYYLNEKQ